MEYIIKYTKMIFQLQCVLSLVVCCKSYHLNFDFMTSDDMERYFNVKSAAEVPEYEIVNPEAFSTHTRRKRNIEYEADTKDIKLTAFGEEFHMRLKENTKLLAENLMVDIHNEDGIVRTPLTSKRCFYHGTLLSHNVSSIAVSTCKGLMGTIALKKHDLYIRPLNENHAEQYKRKRRGIENPHIIYRRAADQEMMEEGDPHFCGLDPEYPDAHIYRDAMHDKMIEIMAQVDADVPVDMFGRPPTTPSHDEGGVSGGRRKRQASETKYLEIRIMVDRDMSVYYGDDVIPYTLTLMNVVAARYAEPSLGIEVVIHIVKFGVLNTDTYTENGITLEVSTDGRATLDSWSNYQWRTNKYYDEDPNHWDNAMLISRKDLKSGSSNSLLGIAWLSGTCYLPLQAGLSQDAGLSSGQIIAHEIGHTLGMPHDGGNNCPDKVNVMSSSRPNGPDAFAWSTCSNQYFRTFLSSIWKTCLDDYPQYISEFTIESQDRPGSKPEFTPDEQCRRLWSGFTKSCTADLESICGNLHCERAIDGACYTNIPAADGTYCAAGKWCVSGHCVSNNGEAPPPVDGDWSSWESFSQCSRTCGGGISTRRRYCDDPPTQNGGAVCEGNDVEHILCNREDCETTQLDFAHDQCAATNTESWNGNFHTWTAYFTGLTGDGLCAFRCLASANFVVSRGEEFADGTRCSNDGTNDLLKCVNGKCIEFACDGSTDSSQRYDKCRVCGGDGSTCTQVTGTYSGGNQNVLTTFLEIPVGATSAKITNTQHRYSFIAVKPTNADNYIFGETATSPSGEYIYQGTILKYTSTSDQETLYIDGPTTAPLNVQIFLSYDPSSSPLYRPQVNYEYYIPSSNTPPVNTNYWVTSAGPCSVTCGNGVTVENVQCFSPSLSTVVADSLCDVSKRPSPIVGECSKTPCQERGQWTRQLGECSVTCGTGVAIERVICTGSQSQQIANNQCDQATKPTPSAPKPCSMPICPSLWLPFGFGGCSATCGTGIQIRDVWCVRSNGENLVRLDDSACVEEEPSATKDCTNPTECPIRGVWVTLSSECSTTCGDGTMTKYITCRPSQSSDQILPDSQCLQPKPPSQTQCNLRECKVGIWVISEFSECSVSCGGGIRTRKVVCESSGSSPQPLSDSVCKDQKPHTREVCKQEICPVGVWVPAPFSKCSVSCGGGTKIRTVTCRDQSNQQILPFSSCLGNRPATSEQCNMQTCPPPDTDYSWFVLNSYGPCSVTCGSGTQSQLIWCIDRSSTSNFFQVTDSHCAGKPKPEGAEKLCGVVPCEVQGKWFTTQFSECSASCGQGMRLRDVYCHSTIDSTRLEESACDPSTKPSTEQLCNNRACDTLPPLVSNVQSDQGVFCAGLFTREVNKVDRISSSTGGRFCKEGIVAPTGQTIRLTFSRCNIRCAEETDQGFVRDGDNTYEFCCYDNAFSWTSSSNVVQVEHLTVDPGHGYEMTVEFLGQPIGEASTCDRVFTTPTGQVSSPNYPLVYPNNLQCKYYIVAPPGKKVSITFETFNLYSNSAVQGAEFCYDSSGDYVQVSDLESHEKILYCGIKTFPYQLRLPQIENRVLIQFKSDGNSNTNSNDLPNGFRANYQFVDA